MGLLKKITKVNIENALKYISSHNEVKKINHKNIDSKIGLVLDYNFHINRRWVCASTYYLYEAIIKEFKPIIISSQRDYDRYKSSLKVIISSEPGWAAPVIKYNDRCIKYIYYSDPHLNTEERYKYFINNKFNFLLSYYFYPFLYHFSKFNFYSKYLIHMPWAIPDKLFFNPSIANKNQEYIAIFGGSNHEAYETRNWCRKFDFVKNFYNSGCENKVMTDEEYLIWISNFDSAIAAGSLNKKYRLTVPKYFEILGAGALLLAQYTDDLEILGFKDNFNCLIFDKMNFKNVALDYIHNRNRKYYLDVRKNGVKLIQEKHLVSHRIKKLKGHIAENINL